MAWNERTGQNEPDYIDPIFNVGSNPDDLPTLGFEPDWLLRGLPSPTTSSQPTASEPTFPGTTTPIGNIARGALSNYSDYRNLLNIPRIGNTQGANLIRGRAGRAAGGGVDRF